MGKDNVPVVAMLGRVRTLVLYDVCYDEIRYTTRQFHMYEGHKPDTVTYPVRIMARLGVREIISAYRSVWVSK